MRQWKHLIVITAFIKEIKIIILEIRCTWGKSVKILDNLKNCVKTGSVNLSFQKGTCLLTSAIVSFKLPPFFIPSSVTLIINQYSGTNDISQKLELRRVQSVGHILFRLHKILQILRHKRIRHEKKKEILTSLWFTSPAAMLYTKISPDDVPRAMESTTESVVFFAVFCFFLLWTT